MQSLHCCAGFSLVAASRGYSLVVVLGLLIVVASLVGKLWALGDVGSVVVVPRLKNTGSIVVVHRLSCSTAYGIFLHQGSNQCLLL